MAYPLALNNPTDNKPRKKVDLTYLTNIKKSVDGIKTRMSANGIIKNDTPEKKKIKITDLQQEATNNNPPEDNTTTTETNDKSPESGTYFFDQKRPVRMDDILTEKSDNTKAPVYDYKKLEDKPITKKIYRDRVNDPQNTEPTFPIAQPQETETGSIIPADNTEENLQQEELKMRTDWLDKINSGEINLPKWVNSLPDNQKLQYVGATYNNNPIYTAITTLQEPLLHLENVLRTGANKVLGTDLKTMEPANMKAENEDDKLIEFGVNLVTNLIPLGASIKGANLLLSGVKSPMIRHMLSSGLGFMINSQPDLLDNLTQGKMELKDYAIQNAVDFGTGVSFGLFPPGSPLKYEIPYQSIVPTMVPVLADLLQGKEINGEEVLGNAITNALLGLVMNGQLPKDTKVKEITGKIKTELKGYAEEQITPELMNNVIAGYLPPAKLENYSEIPRINKGDPSTGVKPFIETGRISEGKDIIEVDPRGNAIKRIEKDPEEMLLSKGIIVKGELGYRFDLDSPSGKGTVDTKTENAESRNEVAKIKDLAGRISKGENNFTAEDLQLQRNYPNELETALREISKEIPKEIPKDPNSIKEVKPVGINITADPQAEREMKSEESRIDDDIKSKYNKEVIPEITNPVLINTQSQRVRDKVENFNNAIKEHNLQFEKVSNSNEQKNDVRVEQMKDVENRINELQKEAKTLSNKKGVRKIVDKIDRLLEQKDILEKGMREDLKYKDESGLRKESNELKEKKSTGLISKEQYDKSIKSIKNRAKNLYSGPLDPGALKDLTTVGLYYFERGIKTFAGWSRRLISELGEKVKPHLKKIWDEITTPKNVKKFKEDNPDADLHYNGLGLNNPDETYSEYAKRVFKAGGKIPTREEYVSEKTNTAKVESEKDIIKPTVNEKIKSDPGDVKPPAGIKKDDADRERTGKRKNASENEKYMNKVNDKITERIDKISEKGYKGQRLYDKAETEIRNHILNDPEFKKLKVDQKKAVLRGVKNSFKEEYRKNSDYYNEDGFEYVERGFRDKVFNKGLKQSLNVVRQMGEAGKEYADRMLKMADEERAWMGKANGVILDIAALNKAEKVNLDKIWEAKMNERIPPNYLNDNVKNVDVIIDNYFKDIAAEMKKRAFSTSNKLTGDVYPFTPKDNYRPRMFNEKIDDLDIVYDMRGEPKRNIEREKILRHLVETKQAPDLAEASMLLNNEIARSRIFKAGNVEYSRTERVRLPDEYYITDPVTSLIKYAKRVSARISFVDAWGMNGSIGKRLMDDMRKDHKNFKFAEELFKRENNQLTDNEREALKDVNSIKSLMALTKFTVFTTLRNSLQGILGTTARGNLKAAFNGVGKSLSPVMRRYAAEAGVLADDLEGFIKEAFVGSNQSKILGFPVGKIASVYLDLIQFSRTDRANRIISAVGGFSFMKDMLKRIQSNSIFKERAYREFERMGLNTEEIVKRGEFTIDERSKIMRRFAYDTQFSTRPQDLPLFWSSPFGKLVTQWKPFGYKMTQMIRDTVIYETKKGNLFPLITYLTAYGVAGETVNYIIDNVRGTTSFDPKKDDWEEPNERTLLYKAAHGDISGFVKRLLEDMAGLGALSLFVDIGRTLGYGKGSLYQRIGNVSSVLSGPALSELYDSFGEIIIPPVSYVFQYEDDFKKSVKNTLKGITDVALRNIPAGGNLRTLGLSKLVMKWLFPEKKSIKDTFKDTLNSDERKEFKKYDELKKSRDNMKEKALETQDPEDINTYKHFRDQFEKMDNNSDVIEKYKDFKKEKYDDSKDIEEMLNE